MAPPPTLAVGAAESQDIKENDAQEVKELPLPPAMLMTAETTPANNFMKKSASTRSLSSVSMKAMSMKLPRSMSLAWKDGEEKNNQKKKGKLKHEDSVWMKTIILGEKCKVPDEDEAVIYDGKGKRISTYHKKASSSFSAMSRQNSQIDLKAIPSQDREKGVSRKDGVRMAEWSKAPDSSSGLRERANSPSPKPTAASPPIDKQTPAGIYENLKNNYYRADGQNCGNFITENRAGSYILLHSFAKHIRLFSCDPRKNNFLMSSSQGSTLSANVAELVDGSSAHEDVSFLDDVPVYVKELIAGGAAGAFAKTVVAPLERTKILLQTRTEGFQSLGVFQSLKKLLKHEGILGFYKGNGASVIRIVPYAALHFMTYEQYRVWILNNCPALGSGPVIDLLAGSVAGGTAVLCTYPLDLARTKLAYQVVDTRGSFRRGMKSICARPAYNGVKDVLASVYKEGGMRALYRGIGPTLTGILPYAGLKFYVYEELKRHVPEEHQSIVMRLSCGAIAGLFGQTMTYPLDVVRRQMQVENLQPSSHGNARYKNSLEGLSTIVRNQGWRQLFAGLSINYIKIVPSVAIGFTAYDMMKVWLRIPPRQKSQSTSTG
ncbi:unnamed protein product [Dovyalis caffra]|uniref:Mitochondrial carrier protein n=1 Tax=Dovyalis caffra TaxID=77055 RepID=A0AAV1SJP6_9ROSI|nr:unnamed protein product [Dovyalis caffra]